MPHEVHALENYVDAEKIIDPDQVNEGDTVQVTLRLSGEGSELGPVDVVLIFDRSASMRGDRLSAMKEAAITFLDYTNVEDKVGLVTYSSDVDIDSDLISMNSTNKVLMQDYIDDITASGQTNIFDAVVEANELLLDSPRINAPLVNVLLADGRHNTPTELEWEDFEDLGNDMKDEGIIIYTIGLGDDVNGERLRDFAEITGGKYYYAPTSEDLLDIFIEIATLLLFAGLDITVTEEIPYYMSYNDDASITPDSDSSVNGDRELIWNVGTLMVGDEWEVTYTAQAEEAVESSDQVVQTSVQYVATDASTTTLNVEPGLVFNNIMVTLLEAKPDEVMQAEIIDITATVESQGNVPVTFDVDFSYNGTLIRSQSITLNPSQSRNVTYAWNTSDVEPETYTITVVIDPSNEIWEEDRSDNEDQVEVEVTPQIQFDVILLVLIILLMMMLLLIGGATTIQRRRYSYPMPPV
jgi:Mg-chelatase subunit ChlD